MNQTVRTRNVRLSTLNIRSRALVSLCFVLLAANGCRSIGPATVKRDRMHYSAAVADSWKEQLLLNIVKTRYGDAPAFLEVSSVVAGYSLETGVSINGQFSPENLRGDSFAGGELSGRFTDRPTISYTPLTGEKFARSLMSPVPLDALWYVIQGGSPADFLLGLTLQSIEGRHNFGVYGGEFSQMEPEFARLLTLMRALQQAHVLEYKLIKSGDTTEVWLQFPPTDAPQHSLSQQLSELKTLLHIPTATQEVQIAYVELAPEPRVVGMRTRSLMQILSTLGTGVRIPEEDSSAGGVVSVDPSHFPTGFVVKSGKQKPKESFVAVFYDSHWFWVERNDLTSKITLAAVTVLFNFLEGSGGKAAPVLTIPTN